MKRRDFLKTTAAGAAAIAASGVLASGCIERGAGRPFNVNTLAGAGGIRLSFMEYELQLRHVFTVSSYSRKTTPGVRVRLEWEGYVGYGEASMPPYLGQSVQTVTAFLSKVDMAQFNDPFQMETILAYVDSLSPGDGAAKAAIDIALHDLVGKLMGQPWWRIWGLDAAKAPSTTFTIGIDTPEVVPAKIAVELPNVKVICLANFSFPTSGKPSI